MLQSIQALQWPREGTLFHTLFQGAPGMGVRCVQDEDLTVRSVGCLGWGMSGSAGSRPGPSLASPSSCSFPSIPEVPIPSVPIPSVPIPGVPIPKLPLPGAQHSQAATAAPAAAIPSLANPEFFDSSPCSETSFQLPVLDLPFPHSGRGTPGIREGISHSILWTDPLFWGC